MSLRDVELKLERAVKHTVDLRAAQEEFLEGDHYGCERTIDDRPEPGLGRTHVFRWTRFTAPPYPLALIAGDALHNARSALDHLAMSLAEHGAESQGKELTPEQQRAVGFPIALTPQKFAGRINGQCLPYVTKKVVDVIEDFQPYKASNDPAAALIWRLSELDNVDKHRHARRGLRGAWRVIYLSRGLALARGIRMIAPVVHVIDVGQINWPAEISEIRPIWRELTTADEYGKPGMEIFRYEFPSPRPPDHSECRITFGLSLSGQHDLFQLQERRDGLRSDGVHRDVRLTPNLAALAAYFARRAVHPQDRR